MRTRSRVLEALHSIRVRGACERVILRHLQLVINDALRDPLPFANHQRFLDNDFAEAFLVFDQRTPKSSMPPSTRRIVVCGRLIVGGSFFFRVSCFNFVSYRCFSKYTRV